MKTDKYYEKVLVKDEKDLPEKSDYYICEWIQDSTQTIIISKIKFNKDDPKSILFWNEFVVWYFRPTSLRDELIGFYKSLWMTKGGLTKGELSIIDKYLTSKL